MCRRNFTWAICQSLDEQMCKTLAVWAGLQIATETCSDEEVIALELCTLYLTDKVARTVATATSIACRPSVSSGVRSAVFAQSMNNFRLHTFHTLTELAKVMGQHFVDNTLADILETNEAPRVA